VTVALLVAGLSGACNTYHPPSRLPANKGGKQRYCHRPVYCKGLVVVDHELCNIGSIARVIELARVIEHYAMA
jgi:hypothetical protein